MLPAGSLFACMCHMPHSTAILLAAVLGQLAAWGATVLLNLDFRLVLHPHGQDRQFPQIYQENHHLSSVCGQQTRHLKKSSCRTKLIGRCSRHTSPSGLQLQQSLMNNDVEQYVHQLINPATRENALLELSKKRENFPELAPFLWYSFGTIAALLQEIISIYPLLSPPALTAHASNRVCNALALLQCVASHTDTRAMFLQGERAAKWLQLA
jgi:hypothetical protein